MDDDRKYRQHGYMDSGRENGDRRPVERPKPNGPRPSIDVTGPRLPRLLQNVVAARCFNCSTTLQQDIDWKGKCPKCAAALHCCKQCAHFEPSTRFQCLKPVPVRIPVKDQDAALKFWTEKVGLKVATDQEMGPGQRWIELSVPGAETGLALFTLKHPAPRPRRVPSSRTWSCWSASPGGST